MPSFLKSNKGGMELIVVVVVILAAFMFAGGESFLDGAIPSEEITPTPTVTNSSSNAWSIEYISTVCDATQHISNVSVGFHGPQTGYFTISIDGTVKSTNQYTPNVQNTEVVSLPLPNSMGFNTKSWSLELFSGGTNMTGGTSKATKTMDATNCQ